MNLPKSALLFLFVLFTAKPLLAVETIWPTNFDLRSQRTPEEWLQPTISGRWDSALFGMVREDGHRFHEGIDLSPASRNGAGEPLDLIRAAMDGQVAYANGANNGPYGRYIVLVHNNAELPVYTLYAHLAALSSLAKVGALLRRGEILGRMGHSAAGVSEIPTSRAHLHFEVGLILSTGFNLWYNSKSENRQSPNLHGLFNGQNLIGMDPLPLFGDNNVDILALHRRQPTALTVALRASKIPDFVLRHPMLVSGDRSRAAGWYVEFSWQGTPLRWTVLETNHPKLPIETWKLLEIAPSLRDLLIRRKMLNANGNSAGELLKQNVEILLTTAN